MGLLEYRRKTLEELFSEYAMKENQSLVVNEVYARIKDTFEMLDRFPSEVAQHYRLFVDPESNSKRPAAEIFGVTLSCDAHELKQELEDSTEKVDLLISKFKELKQVAEPILTQMKAGAEMGMEYKVSAESIKKAMEEFHVPGKCRIDVPNSEEKKSVTRFQAFQAFTDAEHFAYSIWPIVHTLRTREEFIELLNSEFTEEELQLITTAAREGRYPVSLDRFRDIIRIHVPEEDKLIFPTYDVKAEQLEIDNKINQKLEEYRRRVLIEDE